MATVSLDSFCINPKLTNTSITFEHNPSNPGGDSCASYLNLMRMSLSPEVKNSNLNSSSISISIGRKWIDNGELDIFDAKRYFSGVMDENEDLVTKRTMKFSHKKEGEASVKSRSKSKSKSGSESTCSKASANSRSTLLGDRWKRSPKKGKREATGKRFLDIFRCSCSGKNATNVDKDAGREMSLSNGHKILHHVNEIGNRNPLVGGERSWQRRDAMALPNLNLAGGKVAHGREAVDEEKVAACMGMFVSPVLEKHVINSSIRRSGDDDDDDDDDIASESSSDLFEIQNLDINTHPSFHPESAYEPSEASIDWSVVTASTANFSIASENNNDLSTRYHQGKKPVKQQPSLLLGCVRYQAVNVEKPERIHKLSHQQQHSMEGLRMLDFKQARSQHAVPAFSISHARHVL